MQIATWNVNSVRARQERVTAFLQRTNVDVLAMQEIKCKPEQFPVEAFEAIGYKIISHGLNQWNGVAFAYKQDLEAEDIETSFDQQPEFKDVQEARALGATFNGVRVWSLYVPNGRGLDDYICACGVAVPKWIFSTMLMTSVISVRSLSTWSFFPGYSLMT